MVCAPGRGGHDDEMKMRTTSFYCWMLCMDGRACPRYFSRRHNASTCMLVMAGSFFFLFFFFLRLLCATQCVCNESLFFLLLSARCGNRWCCVRGIRVHTGRWKSTYPIILLYILYIMRNAAIARKGRPFLCDFTIENSNVTGPGWHKELRMFIGLLLIIAQHSFDIFSIEQTNHKFINIGPGCAFFFGLLNQT